jgi:hypothetical protein
LMVMAIAGSIFSARDGERMLANASAYRAVIQWPWRLAMVRATAKRRRTERIVRHDKRTGIRFKVEGRGAWRAVSWNRMVTWLREAELHDEDPLLPTAVGGARVLLLLTTGSQCHYPMIFFVSSPRVSVNSHCCSLAISRVSVDPFFGYIGTSERDPIPTRIDWISRRTALYSSLSSATASIFSRCSLNHSARSSHPHSASSRSIRRSTSIRAAFTLVPSL